MCLDMVSLQKDSSQLILSSSKQNKKSYPLLSAAKLSFFKISTNAYYGGYQ